MEKYLSKVCKIDTKTAYFGERERGALPKQTERERERAERKRGRRKTPFPEQTLSRAQLREKRRKNRNMSLTYTIQLLLFFMDQVSCTRYHVWSPSCDHENIICCAIGDTGRMFRLLLLAVVFLERQCVLHFFVARVCFAARRREKKGRHSSSTFVRRRPK